MTAAAARRNRWALSFADLCLVLLACLLMLQATRTSPAAGASVRAAFGAPAADDERIASLLFEPGEAILLPAARATFAELGRGAVASGAAIVIESSGNDGAGRRFDGWELAAARTAAIARAIAAGGLDPVRIDVSVAGTRDRGKSEGQRLRITTVSRAALAH